MGKLKTFEQLRQEAEETARQKISIEQNAWGDERPFLSIPELEQVLGLTIRRDNINKVITFLCQLSAFTDDSQLNLAFSSPSSTGKSYIATEIAKLFPQENREELGYASPKSFFHLHGTYNKETKTRIIDLERRIVLFLDMPHTELLEHLRPLLSHDKREIVLKIVEKQTNRTSNIIIKGFPSFVFCTASPDIKEQETTRFVVLSPEIGEEKIREAIQEKARKEINGPGYEEELERNPQRQALKERILAIRDAHIRAIKIGIEVDELVGGFVLGRERLKPRHARDIGKVCSLAKTLALLNLWQRKTEEVGVIESTKEDFEQALKLWQDIAESQELNLSPYAYELYQKVLLPLFERRQGIARDEIIRKHLDVYGRALSDWALRKMIIPSWESGGIIYQDADPTDRRRMLIYSSLQAKTI